MTARDQKTRWVLYALAALGPIALIIVGVVVLTGGNGGSSKNGADGPPPQINYAALPGVQTGPAPWAPEYAKLPDRLGPLGMHALSAEALAFHIHQHLDVFINGKKTPVPASIGVDDGSFKCDDPEGAGWRIHALIDGLAVQITVHPRVISRRQFTDWVRLTTARELGIEPEQLA